MEQLGYQLRLVTDGISICGSSFFCDFYFGTITLYVRFIVVRTCIVRTVCTLFVLFYFFDTNKFHWLLLFWTNTTLCIVRTKTVHKKVFWLKVRTTSFTSNGAISYRTGTGCCQPPTPRGGSLLFVRASECCIIWYSYKVIQYYLV